MRELTGEGNARRAMLGESTRSVREGPAAAAKGGSPSHPQAAGTPSAAEGTDREASTAASPPWWCPARPDPSLPSPSSSRVSAPQCRPSDTENASTWSSTPTMSTPRPPLLQPRPRRPVLQLSFARSIFGIFYPPVHESNLYHRWASVNRVRH